ncbi:hypothetical protein FRB94_004235 [Tulasnella sp. JGI-2019a]|nr:hypothetical protein FRB93_000236 [Tulasnella sp. JGI-2019a]KAG9015116.1 hypothetical protein FRB94_004235 [Tulasnella sp. JGI-2019a]KAG9039185.1 hypothetical protein FRB95_011770 [Tulasnella sp. JGI-2019a]
MPFVTVWIVRHGETPENAAGIIQGQRDTILNDNGRAQSRAAADALRLITFNRAFTSTLQRASETAEILLEHRRDVPLFDDPLLKERFMGSREGQRPSKKSDQDKTQKRPVWDGEPGPAFVARCLSWWDQAIIPHSKYATNPAIPRKSNIHILAVTHGAVIQRLLFGLTTARNYRGKELLGPPCYNTSITVIRVDAGGGSGEIICVANIEHLKQPGSADNPDLREGEDAAEKDVEVDVPNDAMQGAR